GLDEGRGAGRCDLQKANPGDFARQLRLDGVRRAEEAEGKGHEDSNGVEPSDSLRLMAPSMLVMPVDPADRDGHNTLLAVQDIACSPVFSPPVLQRQPNAGGERRATLSCLPRATHRPLWPVRSTAWLGGVG